MNASDYDEPVTITERPPAGEVSARLQGHSDVLVVLGDEAHRLLDEAFRARALGQESEGKKREETAKYLLSLVASLPTKLRGL